MIHNQTKMQRALDMLKTRCENRLNSKLQFREDDRPLVVRSVRATNEMFELKAGQPFAISSNAVHINKAWEESAKKIEGVTVTETKTAKKKTTSRRKTVK